MRHRLKPQPFDPDRHYQLASPVLVSDPPTLLERTRADIARFKHLWEQLGEVSDNLARDSREWDDSGVLPEDLGQQLLEVAEMFVHNSPENIGGKGVGVLGDTAAVINRYRDTEICLNSSSTGVVKGGTSDTAAASVLQILQGLGYQGAETDLRRFGQEKMRLAIGVYQFCPPGSVKNPARYIRWALENSITPEAQPTPFTRYLGGRYGHVVNR